MINRFFPRPHLSTKCKLLILWHYNLLTTMAKFFRINIAISLYHIVQGLQLSKSSLFSCSFVRLFRSARAFIWYSKHQLFVCTLSRIKRTIHFLRHEIFYFISHFLFSSLVSKNCSPLDVYTFLFYTRTYTSKANLPKSPHNLFFIKSKKKGGKRIHRVLQFIFFRMYFFCPTVSADNV